MPKIDKANGVPSIRFKEQTAPPAAPPAGYHRLYNRGRNWYSINSSSVETPFGNALLASGPDGCWLATNNSINGPTTQTLQWLEEIYDTSIYFRPTHVGNDVITIPPGKTGLYIISVQLATLTSGDSDVARRILVFKRDSLSTVKKAIGVSRYHLGDWNMGFSFTHVLALFEGDQISVDFQVGDSLSFFYGGTILLQRLANLPVGYVELTSGTGS